jgi:di/tricarboxylate transporter
VVAATGLVALAVVLAQPLGMSREAAWTAGLGLLVIGLWATGVVPEYLPALLFFLVAVLARLAPPAIVFSGFASTAFWLVFAGVVIGMAVNRTGLGQRLAQRLTGTFGSRYGAVIVGLVAVGTLLAFVMPAALGRVMLLMPIAMAIADRFGFTAGRNGRTGIALAAGMGCFIPAFGILTANVANLVLAGAAEQQYGLRLTYGTYLLLHFPVLGLGKAAAIAALILWLFPDRSTTPPPAPARPAMKGDERRLAIVLALALAFWATDFAHHVSPAWVGLAAAVLCLFPPLGIMPQKAFADMNWGPVLYIAGILGFAALVAAPGLGDALAAGMMAVLPLDAAAPARGFATLAMAGIALSAAVTIPAVPAVLAPLADDFARAAGLPVETVLMVQVLSFSTLLFPYQGPPLVVAMALGGVRFADATKMTLALAAVTVLVLMPLDYLWWRLLGWVP